MTNMEDRKAILMKQGRCFICLRRGSHLACNCDSKIQCLECGNRHHLAVCDVGRAQYSNSPAVEVPSTQSKRATSAMHVSSSMQVFLQTAQVMVLRPGAQGTQSLNICTIFDTGAQKVIRFPKSGECIKAGDDRDRETTDCYIWRQETRIASS